MKIVNRKAYYQYQIIKEYIAGIKLVGSEVKSLRENNANITDSYVYIFNNEAYLKNAYISKYKESSYLNHLEKADRKLLLTKKEIQEITRETQNVGITLVTLEIFTLNGKFKAKIALARGKKLWNKKETIKERDIERDTKYDHGH